MNSIKRIFTLLILSSAVSYSYAAPDADWPKKPVQMILSFPAGGSTDIFARSIAAPLGEALGQAVVIENKPGAGGMIGMTAAAKANPDGYTLHFSALTNQAIAQALFKNPSVGLQSDFVPVAYVGSVPHVLEVNPSVPAKNMKELVAFIKSKNGNLNYASQGNGTLSQLESVLLLQRINATAVHIPYKGSSFALPDLIAGNTLMMFDSLTASLPHIQSGKLRPIAIASSERSPLIPNVPTFEQDGFKQFDVENLFAIYAPKGTPPAVIMRVENEIRKILTNPDFKSKYANQGIHPQFANADKLSDMTAKEHAKWLKVVKSSDIKVD